MAHRSLIRPTRPARITPFFDVRPETSVMLNPPGSLPDRYVGFPKCPGVVEPVLERLIKVG